MTLQASQASTTWYGQLRGRLRPDSWKLGVCALVPVIMLLLPVPTGLTREAWHLFAMYLAAILGLMLRPLPEPTVLLAVIAISSVVFKNTSTVLAGYSASVVWLPFLAFIICTGV